VQQTLSRLEHDERFADFRDTPGVFYQAAVNNSADPEGFLLASEQPLDGPGFLVVGRLDVTPDVLAGVISAS
jgi:hypothetical protein